MAVFILMIWFISLRFSAPRPVNVILPLGAVAILLDALVPTDFAWTTIIIVLLVVALVIWPPLPEDGEEAQAESEPAPDPAGS